MLRVLYNKNKRQNQDNQDKEVQIKYRESKRKYHLGHGCLYCVCCTVKTKDKRQDKEIRKKYKERTREGMAGVIPLGHGYLCLVFFVCCVGRDLCDGPITGLGVFYRVRVCFIACYEVQQLPSTPTLG